MMDLVGNHLWQSTLCAAAVALLALAFRRSHARVRYALWLAASIKFLVPFSLLVAIGSTIDLGRNQTPAATQTAVWYVQSIGQPFGSHPALAGKSSNLPATIPSDRARWGGAFLFLTWGCGFVAVFSLYLLRLARLRRIVDAAFPLADRRVCMALERLRAAGECRKRIRPALSDASMEPGVFGIFRPVLLLPKGILDRLNDAELEAIIAHEIAHVRRRDNLLAGVHMFVEAVFWFHPMVWWLGGMLVKERENACDEAVLKLGKDPQSYAEGILKVCEFYLESPLECVAGVTGADMKKRIHAIMTLRIGRRLGTAQRLVLAMAGLGALAAPIAIGLLDVSAIRAMPMSVPNLLSDAASIATHAAVGPAQMWSGQKQSTDSSIGASPATAGLAEAPVNSPKPASKPSFEVASVKPATFSDCSQTITLPSGQKATGSRGLRFEPGGRFSGCAPLQQFIITAYQSIDISGAPEWIENTFFQIEAKAEGDPKSDEMLPMLQSLLEERFRLRVDRRNKEVDSYSLLVAKGGHKLKEAKDENGSPIVALPTDEENQKRMKAGNPHPSSLFSTRMDQSEMELATGAITMDGIAILLRRQTGRMVINKTGIPGFFEFALRFAHGNVPLRMSPEVSASAPAEQAPATPAAPSIFTAVEEQLGLRLVPDKASLEFLVINSVEKPSEN